MKKFLKRDETRGKYSPKKISTEKFKLDTVIIFVVVYLTGSSVEVASNQEIDFMLLPQNLFLDADHIKDKITENSTNPGFAYVCLDEKQDRHIVETWKDCCIEENGKLYLSSDLIVQNFYEVVKQACFHTISKVLPKVNIIRQGPAVTISLKNRSPMANPTTSNTSLFKNLGSVDNQTEYDFEFDLVLAIPCRSWPLNHISGFIERIHESPTLIQSEINNYYKFGDSKTVNFHIVPKCSNNLDRYQRLEWRLSLSLLEKFIFKDLKLTERMVPSFGYAFQALKNWKVMICHKYNKVICSYHLKTAFFWTIEAINDQIYNHLLERKKLSESPETRKKIEQLTTASMFTWVVDVFTFFIKQKNMPHYFIQNFNLFQNKDPTELEILSEQFELLKQNPKLVFQEVLKYSSTMKKKTCIKSMPFTNKYSLLLRNPPDWEFQWLNARTGEKEKGNNKKHDKTKPPFVVNLLS